MKQRNKNKQPAPANAGSGTATNGGNNSVRPGSSRKIVLQHLTPEQQMKQRNPAYRFFSLTDV